MAITLSPADGELLFTTEDSFISETITASGDNLPVSWSWILDSDNFSISYNGTSLTVSYISADVLFPFIIKYLDKDQNIQNISKWTDLPDDMENSPEIIALLASLINNKIWSLSVIATDSISETASGNYTLKVNTNYTLNKNILVDELEKRD